MMKLQYMVPITTPNEVTLKKKKRKQRKFVPSTMTAATISTETTVTAETAPPTTIIQMSAVIEPSPDQNVFTIPPSQTVATTVTAVVLPISLPVLTVTRPTQTEEGNLIPLIPTEDQILSPNNISMLEGCT